ncbi:restriction endonuclease subunit S [Gardnerella vaginalis]|uniref:restriction endonuclease subunit S n=1 Tax=Gardnerella vaginalis TaxID=2702 RepID=UPI00336A6AA4
MRKAYEEYKATGIQWLPKIPRHWDWSFLSQITAEKKVKKPKNEMFPVMSLSYGRIIKKKNINSGLVPNNYDNYQIISRGDIILRFTDLQNDHTSLRTGLVMEKGIITSAYTNIKPRTNSSFLAYLLHTYDTLKIFYGLGGGVRQSIGFKDVRYLQLPIPPRDEQEQIVRFLDWKVSSINKLINIKQHEITELKELKKATISDAVTHGLDKTVPMKDSGIPWLGKIPQHWALRRNKNIFTEHSEVVGSNSNAYDLLSLTLGGVIRRDLNAGGKFSATYDKYKIVKKGDMIFCLFDIDETPRTVGLSEYNGMITGAYTIMEINNINPLYVYFYYLSLDNNKLLKPLYTGLRKTIKANVFQSVKLPVPPRDEQEQIARFLDARCAEIDRLIAAKQAQITNLHDLKSSLIADVVTGKIDVRDVDIPDYEQVEETLYKSDDNDTLQREDEIPEEV